MIRNYSIDTLKFVCAALIVFLHSNTPYNVLIFPIHRCAVPCFFMISGYLLYKDTNMDERLIRGIKKMLWLLFWSTLLFAAIKILFAIKDNEWDFLSLKALAEFLVLNENPFGFHLWYISAYLYVLVIMVFVSRKNLWRPLFAVIPLLLALDLIFGKYSILIWGREFPYILVRNFLCVGIPYFAIGCLIKRHWAKLSSVKVSLTIGGYFNIYYVNNRK